MVGIHLRRYDLSRRSSTSAASVTLAIDLELLLRAHRSNLATSALWNVILMLLFILLLTFRVQVLFT
jgi:hypothetical protein